MTWASFDADLPPSSSGCGPRWGYTNEKGILLWIDRDRDEEESDDDVIDFEINDRKQYARRRWL